MFYKTVSSVPLFCKDSQVILLSWRVQVRDYGCPVYVYFTLEWCFYGQSRVEKQSNNPDLSGLVVKAVGSTRCESHH